MKKLTVFIALIFVSATGIAQSAKTTIYLIREGMHEGSAVACSIFKDEELLCRLNNKRYSVHDITPGRYTFHTQWSGKKPGNDKRGDIVLTIEEGKTYYLKFNPVAKAFNGYVGLIEVTENTFQSVLANLKPDEECL